MELNEKQRQFIHEYIKDFNATQAAIRAGYSKRSAGVQGSDLLKKPKIADEIQRIQTERHNAAIMEFDEACRILTDIARGRVVDYMDEDGRIDIRQIRETHPHAVQSIDHDMKIEGSNQDPEYIHVTKLKLHSPIAAIQQLAKMKNWESPVNHNVSVQKSFAEMILDARKEEQSRKATDGD